MKKLILSLFCASLAAGLVAQTKAKVGDNVGAFTETNSCNSTSKKISDVTATGKSILIVASGYDCSICRGEAPGIKTFNDNNKAILEVWGAMHNRFTANTPTCNNLTSWRSSYTWDAIFMFNDVNRVSPKYWAEDYTHYTVISPDNLVDYFGDNGTTARARAKTLSRVTGVEQKLEAADVYTFYNNSFEFGQEINNLVIFNTAGQKVVEIANPSEKLALTLTSGLYIVNVQTTKGIVQSKIVIE
jgi:hypothetical protein